MTSPTLGLVLAAGAGRRWGGPKALVVDDNGDSWLTHQVTTLLAASCSPVIVVLGAEAERSRALLDDDERVLTVIAGDWAAGMSASLRAGLAAAAETDASAALITLVDLPGLPVEAAARVVRGHAAGDLRQATYGGRPGHPVLVGRDHWAALAAELTGDAGARGYLAAHDATPVECSDLWDGIDVDRH